LVLLWIIVIVIVKLTFDPISITDIRSPDPLYHRVRNAPEKWICSVETGGWSLLELA
jgi:hypothetical protein